MSKVFLQINFKETFLFKNRLFYLIPGILITLILIFFGNLYIKNFVQTNFPIFTKNTFIDSSIASLSIQNSQLVIDFDIAKGDEKSLKQFSNSLGITTDWTKGISIILDKDTLAKLQNNLPTKVSLKFKQKEVSFYNTSPPSLKSALPEKSYKFATASSKLDFNVSGGNLGLNIVDPEPLLQYATVSGKLHLSPQLQGLFALLQKIATIELSIKDKNLSGKITLK